MSSKLRRLLLELLNSVENRGSSYCSPATAKCANAVLNHRGVPVHDRDVIKIDAELVCSKLSKRRLLPLSVWRRAGQYRDFTRRLYSDGCALPSACRSRGRRTDRADFDIGRNADSDDSSLLTGLLLIRAHLIVICNTERLLQRSLVIAAVVKEPGRGLERKLTWLGEVLATHFNGIQPKLRGNQVRASLDHLCSFRPSRAAIRIRRHLVSEHRGDIHLYGRDLVTTRQHQTGQCRNRRS